MRIILFSCCFFWFVVSAFSQIDNKQEDIIENAVQNTESEFENESILEDLSQLNEVRLLVNDTTNHFLKLEQYGLISPVQVHSLKEYIQQYGALKSVNELIAVPDFTKEDVARIKPFVSVGEERESAISFQEQFQLGRSQFIFRNQMLVENQKGFLGNAETRKYLGNKQKTYFKLRHQYRDKMSIGLLGDKDAGEEFLQGANPMGFDFYSAHISLKPNSKLIHQVIAGDYEVKIGQGLIQWNGFSLGKGSDATTIYLKAPVLRPYTSSNEFNFLRGGATQLQLHQNWKATVYGSHKKIDATLRTDSLAGNAIYSIQQTGLHRTKSEIERKKNAHEQLAGVHVQFKKNWWTVGVAAQQRMLSDSIIYRNQDYQTFYPKGKQFQHVGINYTAIRNRVYFFGESAMSGGGATAHIHGIQRFFLSGAKATIAYRNYAKHYQSQYASALSENTSVQNERGVYLGFDYSPLPAISVKTYVDYFTFPWKKFRLSKPSKGNEFFLQTIYQPNRQTALEFRTKLENKEINQLAGDSPIHKITPQSRYSNRLELRTYPSKSLYLKSRIGHSFYKTSQKKENGYLLFQDVVYQTEDKKTKLYGRLAVFNTPSFDSRVYAYENDLLYNFSVPAYYGKGTRAYAMASYAPSRQLKFWLKLAQTNFADREVISSGNNQINGNQKTDIKFQMQVKF